MTDENTTRIYKNRIWSAHTVVAEVTQYGDKMALKLTHPGGDIARAYEEAQKISAKFPMSFSLTELNDSVMLEVDAKGGFTEMSEKLAGLNFKEDAPGKFAAKEDGKQNRTEPQGKW